MLYPERTKHGSPHPFSGQRVTLHGSPMDTPSDQEKALSGVWAKYQLLSVTPRLAGNPQAAFQRLTDHEKSLLCHLTENGMWDNSGDERSAQMKGYPGGIKALIDDSTSGGLEAAPIAFDDQVIQTPLLHGELYPKVNEVPISRGRRIEGVSTGTVTGSWGGIDDTAITLFNTASYVAAFDTTIHRWEGAVQIGLDFMSDTPIDFNAHITAQYGERLLEDLDDVVAAGNGTTQPEGVINKSGVTSVAFGGTTSIGNYESLRFGVTKPEHRGPVNATACFCGTETSYQRVKALPVGAADARRLFGTGNFGTNGYDNYSIMDRPYGINESLTNQQIFYAILGRYRMYRRKGFTVRTSTEGDTLIRQNEMLIVVMARYGGQLERGACAAITTTAPA
jgi:HK97 family phage major capsid protein